MDCPPSSDTYNLRSQMIIDSSATQSVVILKIQILIHVYFALSGKSKNNSNNRLLNMIDHPGQLGFNISCFIFMNNALDCHTIQKARCFFQFCSSGFFVLGSLNFFNCSFHLRSPLDIPNTTCFILSNTFLGRLMLWHSVPCSDSS